MRAVLFANIGNRDIGSNCKPLFDLKNNIREESKKILDSGNFAKINAILLEPVIENIIPKYELFKIYLFGTNQNKSHAQDTIFISRIVKEIIVRKFGFDENAIKIIEINKNPAHLDEMYGVYGEFFKDITDDANVHFVSVTGGAPAQNSALMFESISRFETKAQITYLPQGLKTPQYLHIGERVYKNLLMREVKALKEKHLYGAAAEIAVKYDLLDKKEICLLKAEEARLSFDFESAIRILESEKDSFLGVEKANLEEKISILQKLADGTKGAQPFSKEYFSAHQALINELYRNMEIKWKQGAYVDFLGRLVRFQEAILRTGFEYATQISTDKQNGRFTAFEKYVEGMDGLKNFLLSEGLKQTNEPSTLALRKTIKYLIERKKGNIDFLKTIKKFADEVNKLTELRNRTIMAHGFEGVSAEKIKETYEGDVLESVETMVSYITKKIFC